MGKQFRLYISHLDAHIEGSASLDMPTGPYEIQDALDKVRLAENEPVLLELEGCRCDELEDAFDHRDLPLDTSRDIYVLNALAEKMSAMDQQELETVGGLIRMEKDPERISAERFYDLMHSAECCHYVNVSNDYGLGKFYVENDFIPDLENVPESVIEKLDFARIGREMREAEGGVFLDEGMGYVVQHSDIIEAHKSLDSTLKKPDYTVLLEVGLPDRGEAELLKLPCSSEALRAILDRYEARGWCDLTWRCADCKIPSLRDTISTCESILEINTAAEVLKELSGIELLTSKALVSVMKPQDLTDALALIEARNDYALERDIASPADVGMSRLQSALQQDEIELLAPHVNLYAYGESAMKKYGMELTEYGGLERWDGQPVQAPQEEQAQAGGMEMM